MSVDPDRVHRTVKLLVDSGEARSIQEAEAALNEFVLQVDVGAGVDDNVSRQAAVLTAVNAGARAFLGGVRVRLSGDTTLESGWNSGDSLSEAVQAYGGVIVSDLDDDSPTVCIGDVSRIVRGAPIVRATFDGWAAGVVEGSATPLAERAWFVPSGVAAGGIAVGEAFESRRGNLRAGRRNQGISLWRPETYWMLPEALGPDDVAIAPQRIWIIGLGHLGQAYLWTIGMLPYRDPADVTLMLQDDDYVTEANESTGLLTPLGAWRGRPKARVLAGALEARGFNVQITERRFFPEGGPRGDEPRLALVGVDNPETRSILSDAGFEFVVDAGLGGGPDRFLDIQTHTFPGNRRSDQIPSWTAGRGAPGEALMSLEAYKRMEEATGDRCGTLEVAGRTVAASFVGATASALVVAEATRYLLDEHRYSVVNASLKGLEMREAVPVIEPPPAGNPGFARLHTEG